MAIIVADKDRKRAGRVGEGRPTKLDDAVMGRAEKYLSSGWREEGDVIPSVEGLSIYLKIDRRTIQRWSADDGEFRRIIEELKDKQAKELLNNGLNSSFNSTICKLILSKHGYTEKTEVTSHITLEQLSDEELAARIESYK